MNLEGFMKRKKLFSFSTRGLALMAAFLLPVLLAVPAVSTRAQARKHLTVEGITEHLGGQMPMDATFKDSQGNTVTLGQIIKKPTVLAFFYCRCAGICPRLLSGIADVVNRMPLSPGKDYQIVTISFDPTDTPKMAADKKANYLNLVQKKMPAKDWIFLTGDEANIRKATDAAGFSYQKAGKMYVHPTTLIVLSPKGKITQYLYGVSYVPSALQLAITDAAQGKVGGKIINTLLPCFSTQAKGNKIVTYVMAGTGIAVLLMAAAFISWLVFTDPKRKSRHNEQMRS